MHAIESVSQQPGYMTTLYIGTPRIQIEPMRNDIKKISSAKLFGNYEAPKHKLSSTVPKSSKLHH